MSIFTTILQPKLIKITDTYIENFNADLQATLDVIDKFQDIYLSQNDRNKTREKAQKDKNATVTLQSIDEGEDESNKQQNLEPTKKPATKSSNSSQDNSDNAERPAAKKRSKHEVEDMSSPEQDKRQKRNASVKAQGIISKQVNVNLTQKLRRENSEASAQPRQSSRSRRLKNHEKENVVPNDLSVVLIKQEKLSIPPEPEPMDIESLPLNIPIKQERNKDGIAMPPPVAPVPKPRKAALKEKPQEEAVEVESTRRSSRSRRGTRDKKNDSIQPPVAAARSNRSSSRVKTDVEERIPPPPVTVEERPKRTRGRKKLSQLRADSGNSTQSSQESLPVVLPPVPVEERPKRTRGRKILSELQAVCGNSTQTSRESLPGSPAEKPRPKRTRRAQKAEKEQPKAMEPETVISPKEERTSHDQIISSPVISSSVISKKGNSTSRIKQDKTQSIIELDITKKLTKTDNTEKDSDNAEALDKDLAKAKTTDIELANTNPTGKESAKSTADKDEAKSKKDKNIAKSDKEVANTKINGLVKSKTAETMAKAKSIDQVDDAALDETRVLSKATEMDQTMVLLNGVYNHAPVTPKNIQMNETVVLDKTMLLDKPTVVMNTTVVLDKEPVTKNLTDDNSLITDDSDTPDDIPGTPPKSKIPVLEPTSAVKEKVQQFEEMATRVTRTKTRAMAKKEEDKDETQTPPERVCKVVLTNETLTKMNSLIFNGKAPQISSSASKPRTMVPPVKPVTSSASKLSGINKWKDAAEETQRREDARRKKEAMLEAKRELQKRKREEKMAAAAAARSAAERERRAVLEAAARERMEKQAHVESEKVERMKEIERKKQELARKVLETEERRKAEEAARQQRLAEEQRRANEQRKKQIEEQEAMKREELRMNKEIEKKHREYLEKQKKQKIDKMHTPFKTPGTPLARLHGYTPLPPAYMEDGFQYLNSDEDAEPPERPIPTWSSSKVRRHRLTVQALMKQHLIDRLFSVGVYSPDLSEIFPSVDRARFKRTSSAVWHTPPSHVRY